MAGEKKTQSGSIRIIPLGGFDRIGRNMMVIESEDSMIVIDCGTSFAEDQILGIDTSVPDVKYLQEHADKLKGYILTHGHEDHIGALPYILPLANAPVYGTPLTMQLVRNRLQEKGILKNCRLKTIKTGQTISLGELRVEFIRTNHSIPDAASLAIYTPAGILIHTGDFKVDYSPLFGEAIDLPRLGMLGYKGVLALITDSTNAMLPGTAPSESLVAEKMEELFHLYRDNRIIVVTFASNVDRVQQIIRTAQKHDRKVALHGKAMLGILQTAEELGYFHNAKGTVIRTEDLNLYPGHKTVLITTGSQGGSADLLARMTEGDSDVGAIRPGDVIIFSSTPFPGNEKAFARMVSRLEESGAIVVSGNMHVSGHACAEDLKLIYNLVKPQYAIPAHGEFRHRAAGAKIAENAGIERSKIFLLDNGDVLTLTADSAAVTERVPAEEVLVDGESVGEVGAVVLKERKALSESGMLAISLIFDAKTGRLLAEPTIRSKGFIYENEAEALFEEVRRFVRDLVIELSGKRQRGVDHRKLRNAIKKNLGEWLARKVGRKPVIVVISTELPDV